MSSPQKKIINRNVGNIMSKNKCELSKKSFYSQYYQHFKNNFVYMHIATK